MNNDPYRISKRGNLLKDNVAMFLPRETPLVLWGQLPWQRAEQNNVHVQGGTSRMAITMLAC